MSSVINGIFREKNIVNEFLIDYFMEENWFQSGAISMISQHILFSFINSFSLVLLSRKDFRLVQFKPIFAIENN